MTDFSGAAGEIPLLNNLNQCILCGSSPIANLNRAVAAAVGIPLPVPYRAPARVATPKAVASSAPARPTLNLPKVTSTIGLIQAATTSTHFILGDMSRLPRGGPATSGSVYRPFNLLGAGSAAYDYAKVGAVVGAAFGCGTGAISGVIGGTIAGAAAAGVGAIPGAVAGGTVGCAQGSAAGGWIGGIAGGAVGWFLGGNNHPWAGNLAH